MAQHCLQTRALTRCTHCHSSTPCAPLAVHADEIKPRRPPAREHSGRSDIKYIRKKACARALHVNRLLLFLSCTSVRTVRRHAGLGYLLSAPPPCLIRVSVSVAHHREPHGRIYHTFCILDIQGMCICRMSVGGSVCWFACFIMRISVD